MARYYPSRAYRERVVGHVKLHCVVTAKGDLASCEVQSESPPDFGFGSATLELAKYFRLARVAQDGTPVEGRPYEFWVTWRLP